MIQCPPPSLKHPGCTEDAKHLDVRLLLAESKENHREIIFAGTDYGLVTMDTTTKLSLAEIQNKVALYNRYSLLANFEANDSEDTEMMLETSPEPQEKMECIRLTAQQLNQCGLNRKHEKKRKRRKRGIHMFFKLKIFSEKIV